MADQNLSWVFILIGSDCDKLNRRAVGVERR